MHKVQWCQQDALCSKASAQGLPRFNFTKPAVRQQRNKKPGFNRVSEGETIATRSQLTYLCKLKAECHTLSYLDRMGI